MATAETLTEDETREARVEDLGNAMVNATSRIERQSLWVMLRDEINNRSPEQITKMEQERGLI